MSADVTPATTWVERIRPHLVGAVENIIAAGRELTEAKAALPHGAFGPLLDELGLSPYVANQFMRVANNNVLSKCCPGNTLPAAVTILDELTKLDDKVLEAKIAAGEITASTTKKQAKQLVNYAKDPYCSRQAVTDDDWSDVDDLLATWATQGLFDECLNPEFRMILAVQVAAEHYWQSGEMRPVPAWWPADVEPFHHQAFNLVTEFVTWMRDVGIEPVSFMEEFLTEGPMNLGRHLDDDALARWCVVCPDFTADDRRNAAFGHWFYWNTSRTAPALKPMALKEAVSS